MLFFFLLSITFAALVIAFVERIIPHFPSFNQNTPASGTYRRLCFLRSIYRPNRAILRLAAKKILTNFLPLSIESFSMADSFKTGFTFRTEMYAPIVRQ